MLESQKLKTKSIEFLNFNIDTLRNKAAEILSRPNNPELEMEFRATCSTYKRNPSPYDPLIEKAYQNYLNAYQQKTSVYNFKGDCHWAKLYIYNTETEVEKVKIIKTNQNY